MPHQLHRDGARPDPCDDLESASARLDAWFAACPGAFVAFSGGVDSALVAFWARRCLGPRRAVACTADSPSLKRADLATARTFCENHDIALRVLATNELDNPDYVANSNDRCFHCKTTLYTRLAGMLAREGAEGWILSGANLDDLRDYRPGLLAADRAAVRHPLLECGIGKALIRALARSHGLVVWDKPASPCLSSRIPYGQPVSRDKLIRIEAAERWLAERGFPVCRVRHAEDGARVELPVDRLGEARELWLELEQALLALGFTWVELDEEGFVSGKLNRAIGRAPAGAAT